MSENKFLSRNAAWIDAESLAKRSAELDCSAAVSEKSLLAEDAMDNQEEIFESAVVASDNSAEITKNRRKLSHRRKTKFKRIISEESTPVSKDVVSPVTTASKLEKLNSAETVSEKALISEDAMTVPGMAHKIAVVAESTSAKISKRRRRRSHKRKVKYKRKITKKSTPFIKDMSSLITTAITSDQLDRNGAASEKPPLASDALAVPKKLSGNAVFDGSTSAKINRKRKRFQKGKKISKRKISKKSTSFMKDVASPVTIEMISQKPNSDALLAEDAMDNQEEISESAVVAADNSAEITKNGRKLSHRRKTKSKRKISEKSTSFIKDVACSVVATGASEKLNSSAAVSEKNVIAEDAMAVQEEVHKMVVKTETASGTISKRRKKRSHKRNKSNRKIKKTTPFIEDVASLITAAERSDEQDIDAVVSEKPLIAEDALVEQENLTGNAVLVESPSIKISNHKVSEKSTLFMKDEARYATNSSKFEGSTELDQDPAFSGKPLICGDGKVVHRETDKVPVVVESKTWKTIRRILRIVFFVVVLKLWKMN